MTIASWPVTVPQFADRGSYNLTPVDARLRTDFESGPARMRQRFTSSIPRLTYTALMSSEEFEIFKGFFRHVLKQGTAWFDTKLWVGEDYTDHRARFVEPYSRADAGHKQVRVTMSLEARELSTIDGGTSYVMTSYGSEFTEDEMNDPLQEAINTTWPTITSGV